MIDSAVLADKVNVYRNTCKKSGLRPTYAGLDALIEWFKYCDHMAADFEEQARAKNKRIW